MKKCIINGKIVLHDGIVEKNLFIDDDKKFKARLFSLSGHTHSKAIWQPACESSYNVALDAHNNYPVDIDIIINDLKEKYCNE